MKLTIQLTDDEGKVSTLYERECKEDTFKYEMSRDAQPIYAQGGFAPPTGFSSRFFKMSISEQSAKEDFSLSLKEVYNDPKILG